MNSFWYKKQKYFLYDPEGDGMQYFDTKEERDKAAQECLKCCFADDAWSEETDQLVLGIVTHSAQKCDEQERPPEHEIDNNGYDLNGNYWEPDWQCVCNYKIRPIENDQLQED